MNYSWYVLRTSKNPSSPNYLSVNLDLVWGSIPCRDLTDLTIKNCTENMSWFALSSLQRSGGKAGKVRVRSCGCHHQDIQWDICTKDLGVNPTKKKKWSPPIGVQPLGHWVVHVVDVRHSVGLSTLEISPRIFRCGDQKWVHWKKNTCQVEPPTGMSTIWLFNVAIEKPL